MTAPLDRYGVCPSCGRSDDDGLRQLRRSGVGGAIIALDDLEAALGTIRHRYPAYAPECEPTLSDTGKQILEMVRYGLTQLRVLAGEPGTQP